MLDAGKNVGVETCGRLAPMPLINRNPPAPFSSQADDWDYPMDITFFYLPFPKGELTDIHRTHQRLKPEYSGTHEVHNQQERVELYLRILRREYAAGRFDGRLDGYKNIVDRYDAERKAGAEAAGLVTGGVAMTSV
jgi:hypothetical protein